MLEVNYDAAPQPNFASITQLMQQSPYPNLRTKTRSSSEVARRSLGIVTLSTLVAPVLVIEQRIDDRAYRSYHISLATEDEHRG